MVPQREHLLKPSLKVDSACGALQFLVAWRFHVGAYRSLKRGTANMDVLVSLGTNASYIFSVIMLLCESTHPHHDHVAIQVRSAARPCCAFCAQPPVRAPCLRFAPLTVTGGQL